LNVIELDESFGGGCGVGGGLAGAECLQLFTLSRQSLRRDWPKAALVPQPRASSKIGARWREHAPLSLDGATDCSLRTTSRTLATVSHQNQTSQELY